jgi:3-oxoacyl-[acyl-carrier-protein] synthase III
MKSEIPESTPFVDSVGACVLAPRKRKGGIIDFEMVTRGEFYGLKTVSIAPSDGIASSVSMVYRSAEDSALQGAYKSERLNGPPKLILRLLRRNHLAVQDVDVFLFHQSRLREEWTKRLKLDETRVPAVEHGGRRANLGAASLLNLLDRELRRNNEEQPNRILMCGIGLGMNYGVLLYEC